MNLTIRIDTSKLLKALLKYGITIEGHEPAPKKVRAKKAEKKTGYTSYFEKFWEAYPRPVDKKAAYEVWCRLVDRGVDIVDVVKGAKAYAEYCKDEGREMKHIKHPSVFLNGECWTNTYKLNVEVKKVDKAKVRFDRCVKEIVDGYEKSGDQDGFMATVYDKWGDCPMYCGFDVVTEAKMKIRR